MNPDIPSSTPTRDGWRFVRHLAGYLVALGVLCAGVQWMVMKPVRDHLGLAASMTLLKREWVRDGWVKFPKDQSGVIALGDSRMLAALSPNDFDAATGGTTRTYNLSLPASTSDAHRAIFRELLATGAKPEWLILGLSPNTASRPDVASYRSIGIANPQELVSVVQSYPEWRKILMDWLWPIRRFQNEFATWLNRLLFKPNQIQGRAAASQMLADQLRDSRGVYANAETLKPGKDDVAKPNFLNIDPDVDPASRDILEMAAAHGIKVLLVSAPVRPGELIRYPETAAMAATVADGLPGIFVSPGYFDPMVLDETFFSDWVHVNPGGSVEFSREVAREFKDLREKQSRDSIPLSHQAP